MTAKIPFLQNIYEGHYLSLEFPSYKIVGEDAESYLQRQTTNDLSNLDIGNMQVNALVDNAGRVCSSFLLSKISTTEFLLVLTDKDRDSFIERFEKFHIAEELELLPFDESIYLSLGCSGEIIGEVNNLPVSLSFSEPKSTKLDDSIFNLLCVFYGLPFYELSGKAELINNTILNNCGVSFSKGCYPGQETVSKIDSRKGAAFKPMLIESNEDLSEELLRSFGKVLKSFDHQVKNYALVLAKRSFHINKMSLSGHGVEAIINYIPVIDNTKKEVAEYCYDMGLEKFHAEDNEQAKVWLERAMDIDPSFEDAYESLGVIYGREEKFKEAIALMEKLKSLNPKCMMAYTNLSLYHMREGNIEIAEKFKADATLLNFELLGEQAKQKKALEVEKEERERKKKMFNDVLEIDTDDSMALNGLGEIALLEKNYSEAKKYYERVVGIDPKYSVAYLGLAEALIKLNKETEDIKKVLEKGISVATSQGELMPANKMQGMLSSLGI